MAKKSITLEGLLNTQNLPTDTGIPQRGTWALNTNVGAAAKKREGWQGG